MTNSRTFLFDADGVAIEPWGFANRLDEEFGITRAMTASFFRGPFQQCLIGKANLQTSLVPFLTEWGWRRSAEEFIDLWMVADDLPCKSILSEVAALRSDGYKCHLASNQEVIRADYMSNHMGFAGLFDRLFFSCHLGVMKPDHLFYEAIEQEIGVKGDQIVFVDDSLAHVEAAREVGWTAIHYQDESDISLLRST